MPPKGETEVEPDVWGSLSPDAPHTRQPRRRQTQPLPGIDPAIASIIRRSAAWLSQDEDAFAQRLYHDTTKLISHPAGDMWAFCQRMVRSLLWVALSEQPLGVVADVLRQVGAQNWAEGFPDRQYDDIAHAIAQTVHTICGHDWSTSAGSAWISYFIWTKPHLLAGAQQAANQRAAAQEAAKREAAQERRAAEREAARVKALSRDSRGGHTHVVGDVNLESVASLLDEDEENENVGYGQIMVAMTRHSRREPPRRTS